MDEGNPIAYSVLPHGVVVYASDGTAVGTVDHVVAAAEQDIFHGLVIKSAGGSHFVEGADVASIHERGVDLSLDAEAVLALEAPHGANKTLKVDTTLHAGGWGEIRDRFRGHRGWRAG